MTTTLFADNEVDSVHGEDARKEIDRELDDLALKLSRGQIATYAEFARAVKAISVSNGHKPTYEKLIERLRERILSRHEEAMYSNEMLQGINVHVLRRLGIDAPKPSETTEH